MRYLVGVVMVVVGTGQFLLRARLARTNTARNQVRYGTDTTLGRLFGGQRAAAAGRIGGGAAGLLIAVAGVLVIAGVVGRF